MFAAFPIVKQVLADLQAAFPDHDVDWGVRNLSDSAHEQPVLTLSVSYSNEEVQIDGSGIARISLMVEVESALNVRSERRLWEEYSQQIDAIVRRRQFVLASAMPIPPDQLPNEDIVGLRMAWTRPAT